MTRLVVASNRLAPIKEGKAATGGLAVGLKAALEARGGVWLGWSGTTKPDASAGLVETTVGRITYAGLDLTPAEHAGHYVGFSNQVLWPLFHYRPDLIAFDRTEFEAYQRVNGHFAVAIAKLADPDDIVWAHDYHLIPLADHARNLGLRQRFGFFLHTPLPPVELLSVLPQGDRLLRQWLAFDLVGFQTEPDRRHFESWAQTLAGVRSIGRGRLAMNGRTVETGAFPIGTDVHGLSRIAEDARRSPTVKRLEASLGGRRLMIGVDRLDYSKGLLRRFDAIGRLFETRPDLRKRATYLQVAPPTRSEVPEYATMRRQLEAKAGHINGRFSELDNVPIRYINRSFAHTTLAGLYRAAAVGVVTPMRDGMNLVAKEYVACQDPEDPGVLVLSRFAGAAQEMTEAVLVNPYDRDEVADALEQALTMPLAERRDRHSQLIATLTAGSIADWQSRFLKRLAG